MIVDEQDVDAWLHLTVLESIVEQNDVDVTVLAVVVGQSVDAIDTLVVDGYRYLRELPLHLEWFVANVSHCRIVVSDDKALGLTFVSPAKHGHAQVVL